MNAVMADEPASGPLVLLVDDDDDLLQFTQHFLDRRGIRVVTAPNGRRALAMLDAIQPDVIVTDMVMPELDGLDLLSEYRSRPGPLSPVIAVSAFQPYLEQARRLGAVAILPKPYNPRELADLVLAVASGRTPEGKQSPSRTVGDERARLKALFDLRLEDWPEESGMRRFLDEVAAHFQVPVAGISAVTEAQQRLVAQCSTAPPDYVGPREQSFCTHAVAARAALLVQDACRNPLFRNNPVVTERGFQFYAGVPLVATHGQAVGTLCVLDFRPHLFTHLDLELLGLFAQRVVAVLEWRDKRAHPNTPDSAFGSLHCIDRELDIYGKALFADLVIVETSRALQRDEPATLVALATTPERLEETVSALRDTSCGMIGRLGLARLGVIVPGKTTDEARRLVKSCAGDEARVAATPLEYYEGATGMALFHVEQALGDAGIA